MKQVLFFLIMVMLIIPMSCTKDESDSTFVANQQQAESKILKEAQGNETLYSYSTWYYNYQCQCMVQVYVWIFCGWPSRNCLPEVVITGNSSDATKRAVDDFTTSYNNSAIESYFSNNTGYKSLFPNLDNIDGIVDSIQSGEIILHYLYNSHDTTKYYIGLPPNIEFSNDWDKWVPNTRCVLRLKDKR